MSKININPDVSIIFERYFSECDREKCGKVRPAEANRFFLRSGLSIDDLYKINEYCGANRLGYFGRSQFYIALRVIALVQSGHCLNEEIIHLDIHHPSPRFDHEVSAEAVKTVLQKSFETSSIIPPPPSKYHMRTFSGNNILHDLHQRSLMNRQHFNSPTVKLQDSNSLKGSLDQFKVRFNSFDQNDKPHNSFFESDDDEINGESYEEENKGLLNPIIKKELSHVYSLNGDDVDLSSSTDHESSSFSGESDNEENEENPCHSHDPTGYTLMEPVEGLAVIPSNKDNTEVIPMATGEQLEYYTKCFQTIQSADTGKVCGSDVISFFQLYYLQEEHIQKILFITNIKPEAEISLVQFSRALHLVTHKKTGFSIPDNEPDNLLPVDFEVPDEPFSFDLSTGEHGDLSTINQISPLHSTGSADGDHSGLDSPDIAMNRSWARQKGRLDLKPMKTSFLSKSFNSPPSVDVKEEMVVVSRPRPYAKKSHSLSQVIPNSVAPPPPPRSSVPSDHFVKTHSMERYADPSGDASSSSSSSTSDKGAICADDDISLRKMSESSKSDMTASRKHSTNSEARRLLLTNIRECKSRNHVLLRLNNEMTSELEELREQRVNLHLQLEYIKQSQFDSQ